MSLWEKTQFQRIFLLSLFRLVNYLGKIYQDFGAVNEYYNKNAIKFLSISAIALTAPSVIYAFFVSFQEIKRKSNPTVKEIFTKFVNGLLLIPWQIKRHLDGLHYSSERVFSFRDSTKEEKIQISNLNKEAEVLEFFEDVYAGFLQLLLQLYIFAITFDFERNDFKKDIFLLGEVIVSGMSIISLLIALRRRDDEKLMGFLSFVGWASMFICRTVLLAITPTYMNKALFASILLLHILFVTVVVYRLAVQSYQIPEGDKGNVPSTTDPNSAENLPLSPIGKENVPSTSNSNNTKNQSFSTATKLIDEESSITNQNETNIPPKKLTAKSKPNLFILSFLFFGLPSLMFWPMMFHLRENKRALKFLTLMTLENIMLLMGYIYYMWNGSTEQHYVLYVVIISNVVAILFLTFYNLIKPTSTDYIVLYDMRQGEIKDSFGIYYDFCDIVFDLTISKEYEEMIKDAKKTMQESKRIEENKNIQNHF